MPEAEHYVLSHAQKRLWLSDQKEANLSIYNIHGAVMLEGNLDILAFNEAIKTVVNRHESLRTTFIVVDGEPMQKICQDIGFKLDILDLSEMADTESIVKEHIKKEGDTPFDLAKGPLIRAKLLKNEENRYSLIIGIHHIISDGWSLEILMKEIFCIYDKYTEGKKEEFLPKLKIQYKDYAAWHNELLTDADKLKKYWHNVLSGTLPVLNTFSDYPRPAVKTYNADVVVFDINKDLTIGLNKLGKDNNASLFMVLLALSKALFHRYTAQEDIIVGTALAGRKPATSLSTSRGRKAMELSASE
ncbi:condensation domain-containing protein [Desulfobacterales bacterium HSG16]|nr:condensation domain-containing protein [Desulfobacterales bacterium HSG16]